MPNTAAPPVRDLLTADQVIEHLLAVPALRRLASTCVLPGVRVAGEWRFHRKDLEAWIAQTIAAGVPDKG